MMNKLTMSFLFLLLAGASGHARECSIPDYAVNAGGSVEVPVILNDASGVSWVNLQVNYDASLLNYVSASKGALGEQFELLDAETEHGVVRCALVNSTNISSGNGALVLLTFTLKAGADEGLMADIALASCQFGDASGVVALNQQTASTLSHGSIESQANPHIDNFGNKLPDWWEDLHGLNKFSMQTPDLDVDGDGASALVEYGLLGDPNVAEQLISISRSNQGDASSFEVRMTLRDDDPSLIYRLLVSQNLEGWTPYAMSRHETSWYLLGDEDSFIGLSRENGDGTSDVHIDHLQKTKRSAFFRIEVDR